MLWWQMLPHWQKYSEAAIQRCSQEKVFRKFAAYFPKKTHLFLRTPLDGCFWILLKGLLIVLEPLALMFWNLNGNFHTTEVIKDLVKYLQIFSRNWIIFQTSLVSRCTPNYLKYNQMHVTISIFPFTKMWVNKF